MKHSTPVTNVHILSWFRSTGENSPYIGSPQVLCCQAVHAAVLFFNMRFVLVYGASMELIEAVNCACNPLGGFRSAFLILEDCVGCAYIVLCITDAFDIK